MKIEIKDDFLKGVLTGMFFTVVLIFAVQGWDLLRYSWFTHKVEELMVQNINLQAAQKIAPPPPRAGQNAAPNVPPAAPSAPVNFQDLKGKASQGPENAPVTLVEFSDFECPFCRKVAPTIEEIMKKYSGKVRRVWRHYPLAMHAGAARTHEASLCAREQGKFWEFHDQIFSEPQPPQGDQALKDIAQKIRLDQKKFENCLQTGRYKPEIESDIAAGTKAGVRGTPALFINGKLFSGAQPLEVFSQAIESELSKKK